MKTKTIRKILSQKVDSWLESIEDKQVKDACARDFIVTGGCIASMLLRENVNDFDIYFKTKETVKLVSEYYVNKIKKEYINLTSDSTIEVIDNKDIPEKEYHHEGDLSKWDTFVAGISTDEDRVKIFIPHIGYWRKEKADEISENSYQPIYLTENAISLSDQIQLVIRFFGNAENIHENYDFMHATNYYHYNNGKRELVLRPDALEALLTKELKYIGSKYPLTSIIRTKKFLNRGFTISAGTYLKILWQVAELDLKDPVVLQEQLIGVDIAYFSALLAILNNIGDTEITYSFISEIIDKVFDQSEEDN